MNIHEASELLSWLTEALEEHPGNEALDNIRKILNLEVFAPHKEDLDRDINIKDIINAKEGQSFEGLLNACPDALYPALVEKLKSLGVDIVFEMYVPGVANMEFNSQNYQQEQQDSLSFESANNIPRRDYLGSVPVVRDPEVEVNFDQLVNKQGANQIINKRGVDQNSLNYSSGQPVSRQDGSIKKQWDDFKKKQISSVKNAKAAKIVNDASRGPGGSNGWGLGT